MFMDPDTGVGLDLAAQIIQQVNRQQQRLNIAQLLCTLHGPGHQPLCKCRLPLQKSANNQDREKLGRNFKLFQFKYRKRDK